MIMNFIYMLAHKGFYTLHSLLEMMVDCAHPTQLAAPEWFTGLHVMIDYSNHTHGLLNHERRCLTTFVSKVLLRLRFWVYVCLLKNLFSINTHDAAKCSVQLELYMIDSTSNHLHMHVFSVIAHW
jgi:hypothetical protein